MSESRKNHLSIDGGQVKEDEHVATYKPIPESEFRTSKSNLSKSKEKVSPDGAEEKLLQKEDVAKIVRVDMADVKYVAGGHRNGDAKIELDANKRQFSGLTKEELLKYAEDPFWVRLRWIMFVLFWAIWLAMLAGAIAIIIRAPKCSPPTPKQWYEKWPLVEADITENDYAGLEADLPSLKQSKVGAVFVNVPTYDVDQSDVIDKFKAFVDKAKTHGIKVIVDLIPNYVSSTHTWFLQSVNRTEPYADYFIWKAANGRDDKNEAIPPNTWVSTLNEPAWTENSQRQEFYLHQYGSTQPDLNFRNEKVVAEFKTVLQKWMKAGAMGVRLNKARQLLVNSTFENDLLSNVKGAVLKEYDFYSHKYTSNQPGLGDLFKNFSAVVDANGPTPGSGETVFTLKEDEEKPDMYLLRPPAAALVVRDDSAVASNKLTKLLKDHWPALQLSSKVENDQELALFALFLPATPVVTRTQLNWGNDTVFSELVSLRDDATVQHGNSSIVAVPAVNSTDVHLLACARWKLGHTGYIAIYNPTEADLSANITSVTSVPASLNVHHVSEAVKALTGYKKQQQKDANDILVPAASTVVLSYVPESTAES